MAKVKQYELKTFVNDRNQEIYPGDKVFIITNGWGEYSFTDGEYLGMRDDKCVVRVPMMKWAWKDANTPEFCTSTLKLNRIYKLA